MVDMERWERFRTLVQPVKRAPVLYRINGFGQALLGSLREVPGTKMYIKGCWLTALFLPVIPIRFYVVSREGNGFRFHGKLSILAFIKLYKWRSIPYLVTAFLEGAALLLLLLAVLGLIAFLKQSAR